MNQPYSEFEGSLIWLLIENTLAELEENQDIEITTRRKYVIGFICKSFCESKILFTKSKADLFSSTHNDND